jgi:flagellar motor switch protein FliM
MGEILSQGEIDSLLSALSSGDVAAEPEEQDVRKIKAYDFLHPDRFSKDQSRALQLLYENFARLFSTSISGFLRTLVDVNLVSVDQLAYDEFIRSVPNPTSINIINASTLNGRALIELSPTLSFAVVDRLMGGSGQEFSKNRELTEIELVLIERVLYRAFDCMQEAWSSVTNVQFTLETAETNPQLFLQLYLPTEMVILMTLEVVVGDSVGTMSICIPYVVLEPVAKQLSARSYFTSGEVHVAEESKAVLKNRLRGVELEVAAFLGDIDLTVRDLLQLSMGDVMQTQTKKDKDIWLKVGNDFRYLGLPGLHEGKKAVRISRIIKPGDII